MVRQRKIHSQGIALVIQNLLCRRLSWLQYIQTPICLSNIRVSLPDALPNGVNLEISTVWRSSNFDEGRMNRV